LFAISKYNILEVQFCFLYASSCALLEKAHWLFADIVEHRSASEINEFKNCKSVCWGFVLFSSGRWGVNSRGTPSFVYKNSHLFSSSPV